MTRHTTHQTIQTKRGPRTVQIERRPIAERMKPPIAPKSSREPRYAAKSDGLVINVANSDPWAQAGFLGRLKGISENEGI